MPLAGLCALLLPCLGCGSDHEPDVTSAANTTGGSGEPAQPSAGRAGATTGAGGSSPEGIDGRAGAGTSSDASASAGSGGKSNSEQNGARPPPIDGRSIYSLECHGDSKDCQLATTPCFGVGSQAPNVAAGWACSNRCNSSADCSDAPSGAEARAACVPFTSASHCVLICQNETQTFTCPDGMGCYVPAKSPLGYCLWQ